MIILQNERVRAELRPDLGGGVASLVARAGDEEIHLLRPAKADPDFFNDMGSYPLAPYWNRISGGRFRFGGRDYQLETNWNDPGGEMAIHGIACWGSFDVVEHGPSSAVMRIEHDPASGGAALRWPWAVTIEQRCELVEQGLRCTLRTTNRSEEAMPIGMGFHPYFNRALKAGGPEDIALWAPVTGEYPTRWLLACGDAGETKNSSLIAAGGGLDELRCDATYRGLGEAALVSWPSTGWRVRMETSEMLDRLHVFTCHPQDEEATVFSDAYDFVAIEPVSSTSDAVNVAARGEAWSGHRELGPGETAEAVMTLTLERIG